MRKPYPTDLSDAAERVAKELSHISGLLAGVKGEAMNWLREPNRYTALTLFTQSRRRLVFSEVWPGGARRSSRSTCRTDHAELYPPFSNFWGMPPHPSRNTI